MLLREALLILGRDYQILLRRGSPPPSTIAPPPPASQPAAIAPSSEPLTPLNQSTIKVQAGGGSIFRAPAASPLTTRAKIVDSFASDGAATSVLGGLVESAAATASAIPSLFLGEGPHPPTSASALVKAPSASSSTGPGGVMLALKDISKAPAQARTLVNNTLSDLETRVLARVPRFVRFAVYDLKWRLTGSGVEKVKCALRGRKIDLWIVECEDLFCDDHVRPSGPDY